MENSPENANPESAPPRRRRSKPAVSTADSPSRMEKSVASDSTEANERKKSVSALTPSVSGERDSARSKTRDRKYNPPVRRGKASEKNLENLTADRPVRRRCRNGSGNGNRPMVSIITITYNAASELPPTMKSVKEQTFKNYEHLIIDGASTDDTIITARLHRTQNMKIFSEPDKGLYDAMNKGLRLSRGKYVIFLNAGDSFHTTDTLQRYAEAAEKVNADIVYGDTVIVNSQREKIGPRHLSAPDTLTSRSFLHGMLICHQAMLVRKEIAPEYDLQYRFSADYDWAINVINRSKPGKRVNLHSVTTDYLSAGLTDKNKVKSLKERYRVMRNHYGSRAALLAHLSFIPRALLRRLKK